MEESVADLEEAVGLAARAGYVWLEVLLRTELLALQPSDGVALELCAGQRAALAAVLRRVRSPLEEVSPWLGPGVDAAALVAEYAP